MSPSKRLSPIAIGGKSVITPMEESAFENSYTSAQEEHKQPSQPQHKVKQSTQFKNIKITQNNRATTQESLRFYKSPPNGGLDCSSNGMSGKVESLLADQRNHDKQTISFDDNLDNNDGTISNQRRKDQLSGSANGEIDKNKLQDDYCIFNDSYDHIDQGKPMHVHKDSKRRTGNFFQRPVRQKSNANSRSKDDKTSNSRKGSDQIDFYQSATVTYDSFRTASFASDLP